MKNLDLLIPKAEREADRWTWATITSGAPLRIRLDGETAPLNVTPENLVGSLFPGERVWVQIAGRRVIIAGRAGGVGIPTGSVNMFMGSYAPVGWLLCTGGTFDENQYPVLADVLGGNVLPDFRRRFPLGWEYAVSPPVGDVFGSEFIGVNEMPAHFHDMSHEHSDGYASGGEHNHTTPNHTHPGILIGSNDLVWAGDAYAGGAAAGLQGSGGDKVTVQSGGAGYTSTNPHAHWIDNPPIYANTGNQGGGGAYWPRFIVVNYIIKT